MTRATKTRTKAAIWGTVAAAFLVVLALPALAPGTQAAPVSPAGVNTSGSQWAYGGWTWANSSVSFPNGTLGVSSFFGWHVIYTATNTSNSTVELEVERTAAAKLTASFCSPDCANATTQANLSIVGWERSYHFVNLTRQASVTVNGTAVPAWGILNESESAHANLTERVGFSTSHLGGHASSAYLAVDAQGTDQIALSPALGVVPKGVHPGESWTSSAAYNASGAWNASGLFAHTGLAGSTQVVRLAPNGSFDGQGDLTLYGADVGQLSLANGQSTQVIGIEVVGPFEVHEGLLLVPPSLDIFSTGLHPWDDYGQGFASLRTDHADVSPDGLPAAQAAASGYAGAASAVTPTGPATHPAAPSAGPAGEIQAQPESVATAQHDSACLVGTCGPASGGSAGGLAGVFGLVVVAGLLAALVVGTVGVIEYRQWAKRRRRSASLVGPYAGSSAVSPPAPGAQLSGPTRPMVVGQPPLPRPPETQVPPPPPGAL
jgi:hypothetical protein